VDWGIFQGLMLNVVLIPSPWMLNSKVELISIPFDEGDCLSFFSAAKAPVPKESSNSAITSRAFMLNSLAE